MEEILFALILLGLGLYFIMNINNDEKCKYVKNSGTLDTNNNLNYLDSNNNLNNLVNNTTNEVNYNDENYNDYNFFNKDNAKVISD